MALRSNPTAKCKFIRGLFESCTILTCGEAAKPLCLTEETIEFAHIEYGGLGPALFLDNRLDFFPKGLYAFWTGVHCENNANFSTHDLLSQQLVKTECEDLLGNSTRTGRKALGFIRLNKAREQAHEHRQFYDRCRIVYNEVPPLGVRACGISVGASSQG